MEMELVTSWGLRSGHIYGRRMVQYAYVEWTGRSDAYDYKNVKAIYVSWTKSPIDNEIPTLVLCLTNTAFGRLQ